MANHIAQGRTESVGPGVVPLAGCKVRRACPICGSGLACRLFDNAMAAIGAFDMSYTVDVCAACGFVYAGELPQEAQYGAYYAAHSKYDVSAAVSDFDAARGRAAVQLLEGLFASDATIVDVGCGSGALLALLQRAGYRDLHGVDPAPNAPARARDAFGLTGVRRGTMANCHELVPLATADVVLVMAVLEHLWNPARDVGALVARLRPGTRVLVEVPALETFDGDAGEPFGELSLEHIQFFSLATLDSFMARVGARRVRHVFAALPSINVQALLALYEVTGAPDKATACTHDDAALVKEYLAVSARRLDAALARVPPGDLVVWGAGSHTARLLPVLERREDIRVRRVVDANTNLHGSTIGGHPIEAPQALAQDASSRVLVSSYRFQAEIAQQLARTYRNPLVTLYDRGGAA